MPGSDSQPSIYAPGVNRSATERTGSSSPAKRAEKVRENDRRIRSALGSIIAETGWSSVTFSGVARRAGLTVGAVYGRAESPAELGNDLWADEIGEFLVTSTATLLDAVESGDEARIRRFATDWDEQVQRVSVLVELLVASLFDDELGEGVGQSARMTMSTVCLPRDRGDAHRAAVATLMLSFFLGRALALRSTGALAPLADEQIAVFASYAAAPPADIDPVDRVPLSFLRVAEPGESASSELDRCVIEVLGRLGYRRCTIARIARAAGVTKGSLASHAATKARLIADAATRTLYTPLEVWESYAPVVRAKGPLVARALFLAEFLRPENRDLWKVNLELAHVALTVPELAAFATPSDTLPHTHLGVMLVACFVEGLADLPFAGPFGAGSAT